MNGMDYKPIHHPCIMVASKDLALCFSLCVQTLTVLTVSTALLYVDVCARRGGEGMCLVYSMNTYNFHEVYSLYM